MADGILNTRTSPDLRIVDAAEYVVALLPDRDELTEVEITLLRSLEMQPEGFEAQHAGALLIRRKDGTPSPIVIYPNGAEALRELLR